MSVTNSKLKTIKACTKNFMKEIQHSQYVSENSESLESFCKTMEKIFCTDVKKYTSSLGLVKTMDGWSVLDKIAQSRHEKVTYVYRASVESTKQHRNVLTNIGKVRLLIRYCLINKCLHIPIEFILNSNSNFYESTSILGDEILTEILRSVLQQISRIPFKLDVSNASFLDYSWTIPEVVKLEVVPTDILGLSVSFADEKAIIVSIRSWSVVTELGSVKIGDVLDNLNGIHICSNTKGRLQKILNMSKKKPVTMTVIKVIYSDSKQFFIPISRLLRQVHLDPEEVKSKYFASSNSLVKPSFKGCSSHVVLYIGWIKVDDEGGSTRAMNAASKLLSSSNHRQSSSSSSNTSLGINSLLPLSLNNHEFVLKNVFFEIGELGLRSLSADENKKVILQHAFMSVSCCGAVPSNHKAFAYVTYELNNNEQEQIAEKDEEEKETNYTCHVFEAKTEQFRDTICSSIGQGFKRTHYAV